MNVTAFEYVFVLASLGLGSLWVYTLYNYSSWIGERWRNERE